MSLFGADHIYDKKLEGCESGNHSLCSGFAKTRPGGGQRWAVKHCSCKCHIEKTEKSRADSVRRFWPTDGSVPQRVHIDIRKRSEVQGGRGKRNKKDRTESGGVV
jgi:hypothetical protein